jgi:hypothetical protein
VVRWASDAPIFDWVYVIASLGVVAVVWTLEVELLAVLGRQEDAGLVGLQLVVEVLGEAAMT